MIYLPWCSCCRDWHCCWLGIYLWSVGTRLCGFRSRKCEIHYSYHTTQSIFYVLYSVPIYHRCRLENLKNEYLMFITLYMPVFCCKENVSVYIAACDPLCFSNRSVFAIVLSSCLYQIFISALPSITSTKFFLSREVLLKMERVRWHLFRDQNYWIWLNKSNFPWIRSSLFSYLWLGTKLLSN